MWRNTAARSFTAWTLVVGVWTVLSFASVLHAQDFPSATKVSETAKVSDSTPADESPAKKELVRSPVKAGSDAGLPGAKTRWTVTKSGEPIEIPLGPMWEEYLDYIKNRNKVTGPAAATITRIEIVGSADDDRANLKAAFTIRLNQADQFVSVPLGLKEGSLRNWTYAGDGEEFPNTEKREVDQGIVWWLRGRGDHRLELSLSVPLLKQLPSRRFVLSLPASPVSTMRMTLPFAAVNAKVLPEQTVFESRPDGAGHTLIEAIGLGTKLDLTWQPNVDIRPTEVSLESQTTIRAQIEADRVLVRADQQIKSLQGQFQQIEVRLPTGAELIKLDDPDKFSYRLDPENRQRVLVSLKDKANSALLSWTLLLPAKMPMPLLIDGFIVEGARKQVGKIGLSIAQGLRLSEPVDPSLLGMNAGEFPASMGPVVRAYQFLGQPFRLAATIDEVKPYFQVKPTMIVTASAQQLSLDGEFEYRVDRDSLNEVVLTWPAQKSEGWVIEAVDEAGVVEGYSVDDKGQIIARLVKHRSGTFSVHIRARRQLKPGEDIAFSLPRPKSASRLSPTNLILVNAENVDPDLTTRGETMFHLLPSSSLEALSLPDAVRDLKASSFRVDTDEQSFGLRIIPQKQRVRTESFTEAKWQDNQFRVVQRLMYDVSYERLAQVRVSIPSEISVERVKFFTSRDLELTPELLSTATGGERHCQLNLPDAQLGRFEIQARFSIPFAKDAAMDTASQVNLPILASLDEPFTQTSVSLAQPDWFDAETLSTPTWKPHVNRQDAWQWMAEGPQSFLPLKLVRSTHASETGSVSRALVTVFLDATGVGAVRAQFRVMTKATSLPVVLPPIVKPPTFFWDGKKLPERDCVESPVGSRRYLIQLSDQLDASSAVHLLTIDYHDTCTNTMGWSDRLELRSPQLPTCSWNQVIWQALLPAGQHMLTYPVAATPMFRWKRIGLFWSRVSDPGAEWLQHWITEGAAEQPPAPDSIVSEKMETFILSVNSIHPSHWFSAR